MILESAALANFNLQLLLETFANVFFAGVCKNSVQSRKKMRDVVALKLVAEFFCVFLRENSYPLQKMCLKNFFRKLRGVIGKFRARNFFVVGFALDEIFCRRPNSQLSETFFGARAKSAVNFFDEKFFLVFGQCRGKFQFKNRARRQRRNSRAFHAPRHDKIFDFDA